MSQTQTLVNGEHSSKTIDNLTSLPVISSSIDTFKSNPYGARSLDITQDTYRKYFAPYLSLAQKPYNYISPYLQKADILTADGLVRVESHFPIVKQEPSVIKRTLLDFAYTPVRYFNSGKDYVLSTYGSEYKKCSRDSSSPSTNNLDPITAIKATLTTSLVLTSDILAYASAFLGRKRAEGADFASAKYHQAQTIASQATRYAQEKKGEAVKLASETGEKAKSYAYATGRSVGEEAEKVRDKAAEKKESAKERASHK